MTAKSLSIKVLVVNPAVAHERYLKVIHGKRSEALDILDRFPIAEKKRLWTKSRPRIGPRK
jgi:hypothetical protein